MKKHCLLYILCLLPVLVKAQAIDNTLSYKNINDNKYFRLNYENDYFSATDIYYTQGIQIELVVPTLKRFPLTKLLLRPHNATVRYGIGLEHEAYTPTSIGHDEILYGDRPFAACLMLKTFSIATTSSNRISTTLSTGIIGQAAGGAEMQTGIHRWLNNVTPHGWKYQIHNDIVLNYQVNYEHELLSVGHYFSLSGNLSGRAGTLNDKVGTGITLMMGYFDSPFGSAIVTKKNFRIYAYEHAEVAAIGYDATLQGGLFNKTSPYVIPSGNITRGIFDNRFGFVAIYHKLYLEYFQAFRSREFSTGSTHVWGGIQIAWGI